MIRQLKRLVGGVADFTSILVLDPLFPAEKIDSAMAAELKEAFAKMPAEIVQSDGRVESEWDDLRRKLRLQFNRSPEAFLRQKPVRLVLSMGNSKTALASYLFLRRSPRWERYCRVLHEDSTGRPFRFWFRPQTSGNQIHHTFHLAHFEQQTGAAVDSMRLIVEFGGGYGSLCRQVHRLGFGGKYVIFDLPELSAVQRYFLRSVGLTILSRDQWLRPEANGIILTTSQAELRELVHTLHQTHSPSLFVATWSLSEVPRTFRDEILEIVGELDHFLIAYQTQFGSVANPEFFRKMIAQRGGKDAWKHLPIYGNPSSFYVLK